MAEKQPTPMIITAAGLRVLAQGQTGLPINITRVSVGDAYLPDGAVVEEMTALINEIRDTPVNSKTIIGDGTVRIDTPISNKGITEPYFLREVGVWAVDNDTGKEVLYAYANYGDAPIFIAADMGYHAINIVHHLFVIVGRAKNVSVVVTEGYGYATEKYVDDAIAKSVKETVAGLFGDSAPIARFWTADKSEPKKVRPATDEDVIAYLFERTAADGETVLLGFNPTDKRIFGINMDRVVTRAVRLTGGNPSMSADDYPGTLSGGNPSMNADDYEGAVDGGDPSTI